jgi:hypothetical protein
MKEGLYDGRTLGRKDSMREGLYEGRTLRMCAMDSLGNSIIKSMIFSAWLFMVLISSCYCAEE